MKKKRHTPKEEKRIRFLGRLSEKFREYIYYINAEKSGLSEQILDKF